MGKNKLARFAANRENPLVIEPGKAFFEQTKGRWHQDFFANHHPITLELACGKGEYTVGLAGHYPGQNFIGVDIKGDRIWKGSQAAMSQGLTNAGFLRINILEIKNFFAPGEVEDIWLINPDPRPRKRDARRRLTHPRFLQLYLDILKPGGTVRLKTDNAGLFEYTLAVAQALPTTDLEYTRDLYESPLYAEHHGIKTKYELLFLEQGHKIHYLKFRFAAGVTTLPEVEIADE